VATDVARFPKLERTMRQKKNHNITESAMRMSIIHIFTKVN